MKAPTSNGGRRFRFLLPAYQLLRNPMNRYFRRLRQIGIAVPSAPPARMAVPRSHQFSLTPRLIPVANRPQLFHPVTQGLMTAILRGSRSDQASALRLCSTNRFGSLGSFLFFFDLDAGIATWGFKTADNGTTAASSAIWPSATAAAPLTPSSLSVSRQFRKR